MSLLCRLSSGLILWTESTHIYSSSCPNTVSPKVAENLEIKVYFSTNTIVALCHAPPQLRNSNCAALVSKPSTVLSWKVVNRYKFRSPWVTKVKIFLALLFWILKFYDVHTLPQDLLRVLNKMLQNIDQFFLSLFFIDIGVPRVLVTFFCPPVNYINKACKVFNLIGLLWSELKGPRYWMWLNWLHVSLVYVEVTAEEESGTSKTRCLSECFLLILRKYLV